MTQRRQPGMTWMVNVQSCVLTDMLMVYICLHSLSVSMMTCNCVCNCEALGGLSYATIPDVICADVRCCGQQRASEHKTDDMIRTRCATAARHVLNINRSRALMPNEAQGKQHTCQRRTCFPAGLSHSHRRFNSGSAVTILCTAGPCPHPVQSPRTPTIDSKIAAARWSADTDGTLTVGATCAGCKDECLQQSRPLSRACAALGPQCSIMTLDSVRYLDRP
jgi:hypothetical protein